MINMLWALLCVCSLVEEPKTIVFFGDSITAGFGLSQEKAYPVYIQKKIDSEKLPYKVINSGVSGETTSGGLSRISWVLKSKVDVFVLALGGNDVLRGINPQETEKNLIAILQSVKDKYPKAELVIAGMKAPPNMGVDYAKKVDDAFVHAAAKTGATVIPFLLAKVAGNKSLNQADGIHPNEKGHQLVAEEVWLILKKIIKQP